MRQLSPPACIVGHLLVHASQAPLAMPEHTFDSILETLAAQRQRVRTAGVLEISGGDIVRADSQLLPRLRAPRRIRPQGGAVHAERNQRQLRQLEALRAARRETR